MAYLRVCGVRGEASEPRRYVRCVTVYTKLWAIFHFNEQTGTPYRELNSECVYINGIAQLSYKMQYWGAYKCVCVFGIMG